MSEWGRLTVTTIRDYLEAQAEEAKRVQQLFWSFVPPEEREASQKRWEAERARLAAVESAKSPDQKLRERQAKCNHKFRRKRSGMYQCLNCKMDTSKLFVTAFEQGKERGREEEQDRAIEE